MSPEAPQIPAPEDAHEWPDLTEKLRELHQWAGSPKYAALSRTSGLANSAISNLIGKNPLRRPTRVTTLRFVEACLVAGRLSPEQVATQAERWATVWDALDQQAGPVPAPADTRPRPRWLVPAIAVAVVAVVGTLLGGVYGVANSGADDNDHPSGAPTTADHATTPDVARCTAEKTAVEDTRAKETWTDVYVCANVPSDVFLRPDADSRKIGILKSNPSWFICWAEGGVGKFSNKIWYYTQGDIDVARSELNSWGFVQAGDVNAAVHPDPAVERECPADLPRREHAAPTTP